MKKRSDTRSSLEVDEFGSSSSKGLVELEAVFEVDSASNSVSLMVEVDSASNSVSLMVELDSVTSSVSTVEAQAAKAPSPSHVVNSDVEEVESRSRLEVKPISRGASPASLI